MTSLLVTPGVLTDAETLPPLPPAKVNGSDSLPLLFLPNIYIIRSGDDVSVRAFITSQWSYSLRVTLWEGLREQSAPPAAGGLPGRGCGTCPRLLRGSPSPAGAGAFPAHLLVGFQTGTVMDFSRSSSRSENLLSRGHGESMSDVSGHPC